MKALTKVGILFGMGLATCALAGFAQSVPSAEPVVMAEQMDPAVRCAGQSFAVEIGEVIIADPCAKTGETCKWPTGMRIPCCSKSDVCKPVGGSGVCRTTTTEPEDPEPVPGETLQGVAEAASEALSAEDSLGAGGWYEH